jgi:hypothetical protein
VPILRANWRSGNQRETSTPNEMQLASQGLKPLGGDARVAKNPVHCRALKMCLADTAGFLLDCSLEGLRIKHTMVSPVEMSQGLNLM